MVVQCPFSTIREILNQLEFCSCIVERERLAESIFKIASENVLQIRKKKNFAAVVIEKLKEWQQSPVDSGEFRIFTSYSFLLVDLQPSLYELNYKN